VNAIIIKILPTSVRVGEAVIMVNPNDPVVSGALRFGVYENAEVALVLSLCKPGNVFVDVGANVGLYTALAGLAVGPSGKVFAFEPEPESFSFLQKTVAENKLLNTKIVQSAASNTNGEHRLYTSSGNRGDHRLYNNADADGSVGVKTLRLDDFLRSEGISKVDILKIDVQGFEGFVIEGMAETIRNSSNISIVMEFWPLGLRSTGTDPSKLLVCLENMGLKIHEIHRAGYIETIIDSSSLADRYQGRRYANLLLTRNDTKWKL